MAKTKRDMMLKARVGQIIKSLEGKEDKEIIYSIAGLCGISHRTASEHFRAHKAQKALKDYDPTINCPHDWSNWFSAPGGLARECKICGKNEYLEKE